MIEFLGSWLMRASRAPLWQILAVGTFVRCIWFAICPNEPTSDQFIYHQSAIDLAAGRGYIDESGNPAGYWPVGYSALLAPAYFVLGAGAASAFLTNLSLWLLTALGIFQLGRLWYGEAAGKVAAWILALYPSLVLYTTCFASEHAFFVGVVWFAYAASRAAGMGNPPPRAEGAMLWAALAGVVAGAAAYTRATIALLGLLLPVLLLLRRASLSEFILRIAVAGAVAVVLLLPWAFRNEEAFGEFHPFSLNGSQNLWMGNHPGTTGGYALLPEEVRSRSLPEREAELGRRARKFIKENPGRYLLLCIQRSIQTLKSDTIAVVWNETGIRKTLGARAMTPLKLLTTTGHFLVWAIVLLGLVRSLSRLLSSREPLTARIVPMEVANVAAFALLAAPFVLIVSGNRYHLPLIPFAALYAAHVLVLWLGETAPDKGVMAQESAPA